MDSARRQRFAAWFTAAYGGVTSETRKRFIRESGISKGRVTQLFDKREPFGERAARNLAVKLGLPEDHFNRDLPLSGDWSNDQHLIAGEAIPVAHRVSHLEKKIDPPEVQWESILSAPLPSRFVLVIRDDAMSVQGQRGLDIGTRATFKRASSAHAGDEVLLSDRDGNLFVRTYHQRRPGEWVAVARNPAYQPLDSKLDGLQVLGILKGYEWD